MNQKNNKSNLEKSQEMSHFYHSKFDDIPTLTSEYYLLHKDSYLLVDVRSQAEQNVSMIPNAITLEQFESRMKKRQRNAFLNSGENHFDHDTQTVVTYCTIGYRSGLEGRRLRDEYNLHGKVMNLDGIVCYTHACSAALPAIDAYIEESQQFLVDPKSKESTLKVHVFGSTWNCVADRFQSIYFSPPVMAWRGAKVGCKGLLSSCFSCCCKGSKHII